MQEEHRVKGEFSMMTWIKATDLLTYPRRENFGNQTKSYCPREIREDKGKRPRHSSL